MELTLQERWEEFLDLIWHDRIQWVRIKYEMLGRMLFWGWNMRNSYDFDAHTIYDMLYLKLDRLYDLFENHSHLMWNSDTQNKDMRRLCEARGLAKKLSKCDCYMRHYMKVRNTYRYEDQGDNSAWYTELVGYRYDNNKTISKEYFRRLSKSAMKLDSAEMKTDKDRLFKLLSDKIDQWWD